MGQVRNDVIRVDDLDVVRGLDVAGLDRAFAFLAQDEGHFITVVQAKHHALEVQHDVHDIFLNTVNGGVLVKNTSDGDLG